MVRVCSLRKIPTRLHGTNFCTSSARCALSFVRQLNGPECTQIVRNTPKCHFRVQWVDQLRSFRKIRMRLRGTNFCTSFGPFRTEFHKATKRPRMHRNSTKCTKNSVLVLMGWFRCVHCEKFRCDIVGRTFALIALVRPVFNRVS